MSRSYCQSLFSPEHFSKVLRTLQNEQELRIMLYFLLCVMGFAGIPMGGQSILWTSRCYTASTLRAGWVTCAFFPRALASGSSAMAKVIGQKKHVF